MRSLVLAILALVVSSAGCVRHARPTAPGRTADFGTCAGACDHYVTCRGDGSAHLRQSCLSECEAIFVTDGVVDHDALGDFEALECSEAVAFVEGDNGRAPGDVPPVRTGALAADR